MFIFPHKIYMDRDGNLWVADQRSANERELTKSPQEKGKGHIVVKFSGRQGPIDARQIRGSRKSAGSFDSTDQHCDRPEWRFVHLGGPQPEYGCSPETVSRISKFTKDGKFIKWFGKMGSGPGEFRGPHDLAMDAQGRLFVADRGNMRIQILDQDGKYLGEWKQFSRPSGIYIRNDMIYVADSESNGVAPHPGWKRGIRIGTLKDGKVLYRIPDPLELKGTSAAEGVAVDAKGNVYGGEVGSRRVAKHIKQ